jgi:hypothetical protein
VRAESTRRGNKQTQRNFTSVYRSALLGSFSLAPCTRSALPLKWQRSQAILVYFTTTGSSVMAALPYANSVE